MEMCTPRELSRILYPIELENYELALLSRVYNMFDTSWDLLLEDQPMTWQQFLIGVFGAHYLSLTAKYQSLLIQLRALQKLSGRIVEYVTDEELHTKLRGEDLPPFVVGLLDLVYLSYSDYNGMFDLERDMWLGEMDDPPLMTCTFDLVEIWFTYRDRLEELRRNERNRGNKPLVKAAE